MLSSYNITSAIIAENNQYLRNYKKQRFCRENTKIHALRKIIWCSRKASQLLPPWSGVKNLVGDKVQFCCWWNFGHPNFARGGDWAQYIREKLIFDPKSQRRLSHLTNVCKFIGLDEIIKKKSIYKAIWDCLLKDLSLSLSHSAVFSPGDQYKNVGCSKRGSWGPSFCHICSMAQTHSSVLFLSCLPSQHFYWTILSLVSFIRLNSQYIPFW